MSHSRKFSKKYLTYERQAEGRGFDVIIGVDEAGRGPLAGPVVAAAVVLQETRFENKIGDSKQLTPLQRENAFHEILAKSQVGVGIVSENVIDTINILEATFLAMSHAVQRLTRKLSPCFPPFPASQNFFY